MASSTIQAQRPKNKSIRKPTFSLLPQNTDTQIHQTSRDAYEEQVTALKQTIDGLLIENSQLKAQMQGLLSFSNDKIQNLEEKCDQQAVDLDNLKQDKINLQSDVNEAHRQHLCTKNKLQKLKKEMEEALISELDEALQCSQLNAVSHGDLVARHQELIASSNGKIQELQEKCDQQLQDMDILRQEMSVLQVQIKEANAEHSSTLKKLNEREMEGEKIQHQAELVKVLKEKLTASVTKAAQHQVELEAIKETLKEKLAEAVAKQDYIDGITSQIGAKDAALAEQESALDSLKMENHKLLEQMQGLLAYSNDKIQDLQAKCDQQAVDLDDLKQDKINLQSDVNEADLQHLCTKNKLQNVEKEMEALVSELNEALQRSQLNAVSHGDLVARHQELIASSNGKIQELQEKCDQQLQDMNILRQEMSVLQVQIKEANAEHSSTLKKLNEREMEGVCIYDNLISEHDSLKSSLSSNLQEKVQHQAELVKVLKEKLTASVTKAAQHQVELEAIKETLKEKLAEAEAKQDYIDGITSQIGAKEAALAEQESALDSLKMEHQKLLEQMQGLLASSNDKIHNLQAKSDQQAVDLENVKQEKINLQSDVNEAHRQHLCTKNKLQKLKKEMEEALISELDEALQSSQLNAVSHGDLVARHQELIASSNGKIQELQEKCEQQLQDMDILRQEISVLRVQIKDADVAHSSTLKKHHHLVKELEDKSQQKLNDVQEQLESASRKARSYDNMISEHEKFKAFFSQATGVSSKLQEKVHSLQSQLLASRQEVSNRDLEIKVVRLELRHALEAKDTASAEQLALAKQLQALEETMSSQGGKFQKEVAELRSELTEKAALDSANKKCVEMETKAAGLTKDFEELQTAMNCKESCFLTEERLNATILATGSGNPDRHAASSAVKKSSYSERRKGRRIKAQDEHRMKSLLNTSDGSRESEGEE